MSNKKDKIDTPAPTVVQMPNMEPKKYTKEELIKVFDDLIFQGEYTEEVTVKGKLKVTFRSRTAEETMQISRYLDSAEFKLVTTMQEQRAFLNLNKSLVSYQGRDLSNVSEEEKTKHVKKLPTSILAALADSLAEFDRKVDQACREAEESF